MSVGTWTENWDTLDPSIWRTDAGQVLPTIWQNTAVFRAVSGASAGTYIYRKPLGAGNSYTMEYTLQIRTIDRLDADYWHLGYPQANDAGSLAALGDDYAIGPYYQGGYGLRTSAGVQYGSLPLAFPRRGSLDTIKIRIGWHYDLAQDVSTYQLWVDGVYSEGSGSSLSLVSDPTWGYAIAHLRMDYPSNGHTSEMSISKITGTYGGTAAENAAWVRNGAGTFFTPTAYPPAGAYGGAQFVSLSVPCGAPILYTTDGSDISITDGGTTVANGSLYAGPIPVSTDTVVKAVSYIQTDPGGNYAIVDAAKASFAYTISGAKPEAIPSYRDRVLPYLLEQYKGDNP